MEIHIDHLSLQRFFQPPLKLTAFNNVLGIFIKFNKPLNFYQIWRFQFISTSSPFTSFYPSFTLLLTFLDFISLCNNQSAATLKSTPSPFAHSPTFIIEGCNFTDIIFHSTDFLHPFFLHLSSLSILLDSEASGSFN